MSTEAFAIVAFTFLWLWWRLRDLDDELDTLRRKVRKLETK